MTINDQIGDEKLQCDINRKAAEVSDLLSGKSINILQAKKYCYIIKTK